MVQERYIEKPRIFFSKGWWRVSHMPRKHRKAWLDRTVKARWGDAHSFVTEMNSDTGVRGGKVCKLEQSPNINAI